MEKTEKELISIEELRNYLDENIKEAEDWEGDLGPNSPTPATDTLCALKEGKVELGNPQHTLKVIDPRKFEENGIGIKESILNEISKPNGWKYLLFHLPVLLFTGRGLKFSLFELQSTLSALSSIMEQPVIHSIFPQGEWRSILEYGVGMDLTINSALQLGIDGAVPLELLAPLKGDITCNMDAESKQFGKIKVNQYTYDLGHALIEAKNNGKTVMWRFDYEKVYNSAKSIDLIVICKVPKDLFEFKVTSSCYAEASINWIAENIEHIFSRLTQPFRKILLDCRGIKYEDSKVWTLKIPETMKE
ncbi:MAG: hypothetical protein AB9903_22610 [Vulcanimicrobiota bacterium]